MSQTYITLLVSVSFPFTQNVINVLRSIRNYVKSDSLSLVTFHRCGVSTALSEEKRHSALMEAVMPIR